MSRILSVGIATLDIINEVDHYPAEDEELRAQHQRLQRGGNAANTACVLTQFGHQVSLLCTLANDAAAGRIRHDLQTHGVMLDQLVTIEKAHTPTSYITLNRRNGSRTIVHYRDLPEVRVGDFEQIDPQGYDWFHFEGRNLEVSETMLRHLTRQRVDQPISIEIEKPRTDIERLYPYADILLFSRAFAEHHDYTCADALFDALRQQKVKAILICSWGAEGAWACDQHGQRYHSPARIPIRVVDTLGAGDTFNAGLIHALLEGQSLSTALRQACELAGRKVGQNGFAGLKPARSEERQ